MPSAPSVIGRYQVRERLGQGGMGALYLALDPAIDRLVAIKVLRVDNEGMRARLLREARSAGRLQHPHIVTIYDVGEHEGQPFIAMEYIKGETLAEIIQRRAPLSLARKITLMEDLCEGLEYAHGAGLVHRDIKPANLMIMSEAGVLKILDFGIARGSGDSSLTEVGTMMGTPNYMSPEQASGKEVDRRSDVFSVGAVIYEMLVYQQAFPGKEWQVVLPSILEKSPEPLTQIDQDLSPRLEAIVGRSLTRNPVERYQELRTLGQDLARFRQQLEDAQAETVLPTPTPTPGGTKPRPPTDRARLDSLRQEKVRTYVEAANDALRRADVQAAQTAAEDASLLDADNTLVLELLREVHDAHERQRFEIHLADASAQLAAKELTQALGLVDQALELQPSDAAARHLRRAVVEAIEERDRQRHRGQLIDRALRTARDALDAGTPDAAIRAVSEVLAYEPGHTEAAALKRQALDATEQRRRQEAVEREARQAVATARREFAEGDHTAAIKRLEALQMTHPIVASTLADLRREAAATKRRLESEPGKASWSDSPVPEQLAAVRTAIDAGRWDEAAERLQVLRDGAPETKTRELAALHDEVQRGRIAARRRQEVTDYLTQARQQQTAGDYPSALALVDAALALRENHADATTLRAEIERQRADEEERREAETAARRRARQQELNARLDAAEATLQAGAPDKALQELQQVDQEDATTTQAARLHELKQLAEARHQAAQEQAKQRRRVEADLRSVRAALDRDELLAARRLVESVLAELPDDGSAQALLDEVTAAETRENEASDLVSQAAGNCIARRV